ncbi:MAG: hypothetical protein AAF798_08580 [Bacteroidota bacterium]
MEQFSNFTYIKQIPIELMQDKFNMSYRIKCLLEEHINLSNYGVAVRHIFISPLIGEVFIPESIYSASEKKLEVQFLINPDQAVAVSEAQFFRIMLEGFLQAMEEMELPYGFNFKVFRKDVEALQFAQLKQAA